MTKLSCSDFPDKSSPTIAKTRPSRGTVVSQLPQGRHIRDLSLSSPKNYSGPDLLKMSLSQLDEQRRQLKRDSDSVHEYCTKKAKYDESQQHLVGLEIDAGILQDLLKQTCIAVARKTKELAEERAHEVELRQAVEQKQIEIAKLRGVSAPEETVDVGPAVLSGLKGNLMRLEEAYAVSDAERKRDLEDIKQRFT